MLLCVAGDILQVTVLCISFFNSRLHVLRCHILLYVAAGILKVTVMCIRVSLTVDCMCCSDMFCFVLHMVFCRPH